MQEGQAKARPRVVLDSNVLISGLVFEKGKPARILEALRKGEIEVVISPFILEEVSRSFSEDFDWNNRRINQAVQFLLDHCIPVNPNAETTVPELTPADNRVLDCARHGQVEYLVTGDRGILKLRQYEQVKIVTPAEFGKILQAW
jgi:putative PIN family toxin of toxin-antitoxin system